MLRLNMAVPVTQRTDPKFSNEGLIQAAVLGLTDPAYNTTTSLQSIPNMDGFPNGRRLEDDVTRIELQAVSGVVLAAIGLWYDDGSGVTPNLLNVLTYNAGVTSNDASFKSSFPYVASPWAGTHICDCDNISTKSANKNERTIGDVPITKAPEANLGLASPEMNLAAYPNPSEGSSTIKYSVDAPSQVKVAIYDLQGKLIKVLADKKHDAGVYTIQWSNKSMASGTYIITASKNGMEKQMIKVVKN